MAKKRLSQFQLKIVKILGVIIVKILGHTWKFSLMTKAPEKQVIYCFWHRNILPLMYLHRNHDIAVMISQSQDGELIAEACRDFGYVPVRGSSRRGGSKALREMISVAKSYTIGITPDGPKGPAGKIKEGLVFLAKASGLPVVLAAVQVKREIVFSSWDRFRLPLPFTRIRVSYSEPILLKREEDSDEIVTKLEKKMKALERDILF
jgi:lysophospholipid acyltransferase (LPLAT)-like uncharacterized protein